MRKSGGFVALFMAIAPLLAACGTHVPEIQEFPGTPGDAELLVRAITRSIHCELKGAVQYVVGRDVELAKINGRRAAPWFDGWGMEGTLTLTVAEKTDVNPTVSWTPNPVTMLFTLAGGVDLNAQATRIDTLNFYYNVADLLREQPCPPGGVGPHPVGSLLIDADLKFREWLEGQLLSIGTGEITAIAKTGISHDVKFEVVSSGTVTPSWKLRRVSVNSGGPFFTTNRDRTHELSVTFGPADPTQRTLVGSAAGQFLASQIGTAIASRTGNLPAP